MKLVETESYYYYQDEKYATALIVDYASKTVKKIMNCPPKNCINDVTMQYISVNAARYLLDGLHRNCFMEMEMNYGFEKPSDVQLNRAKIYKKINKKRSDSKYFSIILEENRLHDIFAEKRLIYQNLVDRHLDSLHKIDISKFSNFLDQVGYNHDVPELERMNNMVELMLNSKNNGFDDLRNELMNDPMYVESNELAKQIEPAFYDFFKSLIDLEKFMNKEYELYSDKYKEKIEEYAKKGMFLYCLNTPDLPIDDDDVSIDDIYDYFLHDNAMYLKLTFETFITNAPAAGEINVREANDLVASYDLLIEGKYWAALRNLYALIDHHHKLCANLFNGYLEKEKQYKNGKQRSEKISELFNLINMSYYGVAWKNIDVAIEEMNKGTGKRFVSRNAIVHGDYNNSDINPTAKDVVNLFLIYVSLRQMVDHFANIEVAVKDFELYCKGYEMNLKRGKI